MKKQSHYKLTNLNDLKKNKALNSLRLSQQKRHKSKKYKWNKRNRTFNWEQWKIKKKLNKKEGLEKGMKNIKKKGKLKTQNIGKVRSKHFYN